MNNQPKQDCCNGCQNGKPGSNSACQAKLMVEAIKRVQKEQALETKN